MNIKCNNCRSKNIERYEFVRCRDCNQVIKDFDGGLKKRKLKIKFDKKNEKIMIVGNKQGLEFLASCCLSIIEKKDPSGHIHLEWQMNNLLEGSVESILEFSEKPEEY